MLKFKKIMDGQTKIVTKPNYCHNTLVKFERKYQNSTLLRAYLTDQNIKKSLLNFFLLTLDVFNPFILSITS